MNIETKMTLIAADWLDTLKSDQLPQETVRQLGKVIAQSFAKTIFIATMERGLWFHLIDGRSEVQSYIRDCVAN